MTKGIVLSLYFHTVRTMQEADSLAAFYDAIENVTVTVEILS